jgi:hypothetical protein
MVMTSKPAENNSSCPAELRLENALVRLEKYCYDLKNRNHSLQQSQQQASEELGLHLRNLERLLESQE